jgi:hypothetical protein
LVPAEGKVPTERVNKTGIAVTIISDVLLSYVAVV